MTTLATAQSSDLIARLQFDDETIKAAKFVIAPKAPDHIIKLVLYRCSMLNVDPMSKMIYAVPRKNKQGEIEWQLQTSIDCFRTIGGAQDGYEGQIGPLWCGTDGVWNDIWLGPGQPYAAKVGILRAGFREPLWCVARFAAYTAGGQFWEKMGDLMIGKCAEALSWRRAFPQKLSGLYTSDEMQQADRGAPATSPVAIAPPLEPVPTAPAAPTSKDLLALFAATKLPGTLAEWMRENIEKRLGLVDDATGTKVMPTPLQMIETREKLALIVERLPHDEVAVETFEAEFSGGPSDVPEDNPPPAAAPPALGSFQAQMTFGEVTDSGGANPMTAAQRKKIMAMFTERSYSEGNRHAFAAAHLGGEGKASSKTWTWLDAKRIIDKLELIPPTKQPRL